MISNARSSSSAPAMEFKRYCGVGTINVLAINPNNATLKKYGWNVEDSTPEPQYANLQSQDGTKYSRLRFLVQIKDLAGKPVIPMDFRISNDFANSKDNKKTQIIDNYGRSAFATKEEFKSKKVPVDKNGNSLSIDKDYRRAHVGEVDVINFLFKYLNITPFQYYDAAKNTWVQNKAPGTLSIDDWGKIVNGDVSELIGYISEFPDNCMKVIFGLQTTDENRVYQMFIRQKYLGNASVVDKLSGEYKAAQNEINRFMAYHTTGNYIFSAAPVREWSPESTEVKDNSSDEDMPDFPDGVADDNDPLPFDI